MTCWRVGLVGAGIGAEHLQGYRALGDRFRVVTVCDLDTDLAARLAGPAGATVTDRIGDVLEAADIDIVDICLPPALHVPVAIDALAAGKHAIVEKPLAGSLAEADRLQDAAAKTRARVFPVFQYRFGPAFEGLAALGAAGLLGQPQVAALETHWNRGADYYANPWRGSWEREQGGAVLGHAIHAHDLLTRFFGPVAEVSAMLTTRINPIETEDCAAISFRMANGALASSSITLGAADDTSRLRFVFECLTAESGRLPYAPGAGDWRFTARDPGRQGAVDAVLAGLPDAPQGFAGLFAAIADALAGDDGRAVSLDAGLAAVELVSAVYQADRTGQRVRLPLDRGLPIVGDLRP